MRHEYTHKPYALSLLKNVYDADSMKTYYELVILTGTYESSESESSFGNLARFDELAS